MNKKAYTGKVAIQKNQLGILVKGEEAALDQFVAAQEGDMIAFYKNANDVTPVMTVQAKIFENSVGLLFVDSTSNAAKLSVNSLGVRSGEVLATTFGKEHETKMLRQVPVVA